MGCDIHFSVERYNTRTKKWTRMTDPLRECWACNGTTKDKGGAPCKRCEGTGKTREEFYSGRNYNLFAMLADVRNDEGIKPLAAPRGIPKNASKRVKKLAEGWGEDGHSHSWFYLSELLDETYWNTVVAHSGFVEFNAYATWKASGEVFPDEWCKGVGAEIITEGKAQEILADKAADAERRLDDRHGPQKFVDSRWTTRYRDAVRQFMDVIEELRKLTKNPKHVRIVFWFDN